MTTERAPEDTVSFRVENRIAWVQFNRPEKRNCMSPTLNRRMMEVLDELEFRDDVGIGQRRRVAEHPAFGNIAQQASHDLAAPRFRQLLRERHVLGIDELAEFFGDVFA